MKWISTDIDMYMKAKEYVDTIIVPLIPISLEDNATSICEMGEFITIMATELEREYKGRILVLPSFTYMKEENPTELVQRLNKWHDALLNGGVKQILFLTSDPDWKLNEKDLEGTLLWVPAISIQDVDKKYIEQMIKSQMKPLQTIVMNLWKKES